MCEIVKLKLNRGDVVFYDPARIDLSKISIPAGVRFVECYSGGKPVAEALAVVETQDGK